MFTFKIFMKKCWKILPQSFRLIILSAICLRSTSKRSVVSDNAIFYILGPFDRLVALLREPVYMPTVKSRKDSVLFEWMSVDSCWKERIYLCLKMFFQSNRSKIWELALWLSMPILPSFSLWYVD